MSPRIETCVAAVFALLGSAAARAELTVDEVVVIAVAGSPDSIRVAEHYAKARGIPAERICRVDVAPGADLSRRDFDEKVRPAIRAFLTDRKLADKVRCLVAVYDCPLRVGQQELSAEQRARLEYVTGRLNTIIDELTTLTAGLERVAADPPAGQKEKTDRPAADGKVEPRATEKPASRPSAQQAVKAATAALRAADGRVGKLPPGPAREQVGRVLLNYVIGLGGLEEYARRLRGPAAAADAPAELKAEFEKVSRALTEIRDDFRKLTAEPDTPERLKKIEEAVRRGAGLAGAALRFSAEREAASARETEAAFDSELSLLWWSEYPLFRWTANPLHHRFDEQPDRSTQRVLLVSRLETPTVAGTLKMIDDAIAVEKTGLAGKVYLDARGLNADKNPGSYGDYDEAIRRLAAMLKDKTKLDVVLDNKPELFAPGTCPDAALYCGWYSLANYVDAFTWNRGAVGYHIASSEAVTLRSAGSKVWCKRMVELGVCGTMGPVAEPYLSAFCRPDEFFPLLLTGKYTLAECFYRTLNFNSWMNILIGDPLYRPFATNPQLKVEDLPGRLAPPSGWGR